MKSLLPLALALLTACNQRTSSQAAPVPNKTDSGSMHVAADRTAADSMQDDAMFTFCDSSGRFLLAVDHRSPPARPYFAALPNGDLVPLRFVGLQTESKHGTGRHIQSNFGNLGGALFETMDAKLVPDGTYLVVSGHFLSNHRPIPLRALDTVPFDSSWSARVRLERGRELERTWRRHGLDSIGEIGLVLFHRTRDEALASLVAAWGGKLHYEDYPGNISDTESIWRVDDGGVFSPRDISCIAAFRSPTGIMLARTWSGGEGESSALLRDSLGRLVPTLESYRYWSPQ